MSKVSRLGIILASTALLCACSGGSSNNDATANANSKTTPPKGTTPGTNNATTNAKPAGAVARVTKLAVPARIVDLDLVEAQKPTLALYQQGETKLLLIDGSSGATLQEIEMPSAGTDDDVVDVAGGQVIFGSRKSGDTNLYVHNGADGQLAETLDLSLGSISMAAISPDGATLAIVGTDKRRVSLVKRSDKSEIVKIDGPALDSADVKHIEFSPKGDVLAVTAGKVVRLVNATTGDTLQDLSDHSAVINRRPAFSADGSLIAVPAGQRPDPIVKVWRVSSGELVSSISNDSDAVPASAVALLGASGEQLLVTVSVSLRRYTTASGEKVDDFALPQGNTHEIVTAADGKRAWLALDAGELVRWTSPN